MAGKTKNAEARHAPSEASGEARFALTPGRRDTLIVVLYVVVSLLVASVTIWPFVYPEGRPPRLAGPDAHFHLRHAELVLEQFPVIARFDPFTNFPHGEHGLNQGGFDIAVALLSLLTPLSCTTILIWISPVLVASVGALGYLWLSKATSWRCGAMFLLFYLLYPGSLAAMASLGQGDHHAAELFLCLAVMWALHRLLQPETSWKWAPLAALPLFIFYLSWAGTALHLALVGAVFYVRAWKPDDGALWRKGSLYGGSLLLALGLVHYLLPWAVIWSTSETVFLMGSVMLILGYPLLVWLGRRPWRYRVPVAAVTLLVPFLVALVLPPTRQLLLSLTESRTFQIAEHVAVSSSQLQLWFGPVWLLALAAPLVLWYRGQLWQAMVPLVYSGGLVFFWIQTRDFSYYASPLLAAAAAYVLCSLLQGRMLLLVAVLCALPPLLLPKEKVARPWMTLPMVRETMLVTDGLEEASEWLRSVRGEVKPTDPDAFGLAAPWDLGNILAQSTRVPVVWSQTASPELAHLFYSENPDLVYRAFTDNDRRVRYILLPARNLGEKFLGEMFAADLTLAEMFVKAEAVDVGGVSMGPIEPSPRNLATLIVRLYWDFANGLGHYRMVYETSTTAILATKLFPEAGKLEFYSFTLSEKTAEIFKVLLANPRTPMNTSRGWLMSAREASEVRLFEAVPGAVLSGKAEPGMPVRATVELQAPTTGRVWVNTYKARADDAGRFELRVPYPTDVPIAAAPGTVEVRGLYQLKVGKVTREVAVKEADVRAGNTVVLP